MAKTPRKPKAKDYDERIYRKGHPPHRMRNALILIALLIVGTYLALDQGAALPRSEYELNAVFENAANIRKDSPVRIAGVNVGKVHRASAASATPPRSPSPSTTPGARSTRTPRSRSGRASSSRATSSST